MAVQNMQGANKMPSQKVAAKQLIDEHNPSQQQDSCHLSIIPATTILANIHSNVDVRLSTTSGCKMHRRSQKKIKHPLQLFLHYYLIIVLTRMGRVADARRKTQEIRLWGSSMLSPSSQRDEGNDTIREGILRVNPSVDYPELFPPPNPAQNEPVGDDTP